METKTAILELRKNLNLSQLEFAERLLVTRQAVSRWENGETIPSIDTLRMISKTFHVSVDQLLDYPAGICQSCGMNLERDIDKGTNQDESESEEYCSFCYQHGKFAQDITMEEMIELNLRDLDEWNKSVGLHLTKQEARAELMKYLPALKRWRAEAAAKTNE